MCNTSRSHSLPVPAGLGLDFDFEMKVSSILAQFFSPDIFHFRLLGSRTNIFIAYKLLLLLKEKKHS